MIIFYPLMNTGRVNRTEKKGPNVVINIIYNISYQLIHEKCTRTDGSLIILKHVSCYVLLMIF